MPTVILSLGTNTGKLNIIRHAQAEIEQILSDVRHSTTKSTVPIGMGTSNFLNSLTIGKTTLQAEELIKRLKILEQRCGDMKSLRKKGIITMDIDLLLYDGKRYHEDDWQRDYVQELMDELSQKK